MKPSIPKGTRDFSPGELVRRNLIFDTIKNVFRLYGYQPVETPAMENLSTLLGKYGDEGDKLIFKILNSGDYLEGISDDDLLARETGRLSSRMCERGLRYDLTVPFARYVVQHRAEIVFPFKRFQVQPVWRADKPQKGRYREFYQCDADVIGSDSMLNEFELVKIVDEVFSKLGIAVEVKINNRKILTGIAGVIGEASKVTDITVAIDKLDKIGIDAVNEELRNKGIAPAAIEKLQPIIQMKGSIPEKLIILEDILSDSESGLKGIEELRGLFDLINGGDLSCESELDLTLARGLDYYTGAIIEVKSKDVPIGSICGGGRYDNLTGVFGLEGVSGVGISFGADRIYDVMNHLNLFDKASEATTEALILNFGQEEILYALKIRDMLVKDQVSCELYPDAVRLKKQMSYADSRKIPIVIIAGADEIKNRQVTLKNMLSGKQVTMQLEELPGFILQNQELPNHL